MLVTKITSSSFPGNSSPFHALRCLRPHVISLSWMTETCFIHHHTTRQTISWASTCKVTTTSHLHMTRCEETAHPWLALVVTCVVSSNVKVQVKCACCFLNTRSCIGTRTHTPRLPALSTEVEEEGSKSQPAVPKSPHALIYFRRWRPQPPI